MADYIASQTAAMDTKILSGHEVQVVEICEEVEAAAKVMLKAPGFQPDDPAYSQRLYESMNTRYARLLRLPERHHDRDQILAARQIHLQQGMGGHTWDMQPPPIQTPQQPSADLRAIPSQSVQHSRQPSAGSRLQPPPVVQNHIPPAPAHHAPQQPPFKEAPMSHTPVPASAATSAGVHSTVSGSIAGSLTNNAPENPKTLRDNPDFTMSPSDVAELVAAAWYAPSASARTPSPAAQDYQQARQHRDRAPALLSNAQRVPRTITPQDQHQRYLRVLLSGDFQESESIHYHIATSESEAAAGSLLLDANARLARAVYYLATRGGFGSGASLTGQASYAQGQVPSTSRNIPQTGLGATSNRTVGKAKHNLSPQSRNQVHSQPKRRNTGAGLEQENRDSHSARGGMYHSFGHNLTPSSAHAARVGDGAPKMGPWSIIPKEFYGLVPEHPFGSSWYFECAKCQDTHPRRENTFLEHMRMPTHYGLLFVLIDVEEETREWVARPDYHYTTEVRGKMIFEEEYSVIHKNTGSKTPSRDDAAQRPTGKGDIKYKDKQRDRLWGRELLARPTGGSMLATTMPPASAPTPIEEDVIDISSDSKNDREPKHDNDHYADTQINPSPVDKGKSVVRDHRAVTQYPQNSALIHGPNPPETPAQGLLHATFPDGWKRIPTTSGQDNRCGSNAIVNSLAANVDLPGGPPTADEIIAIMRSPSFTDLEVGFTDWDAHDDEGQQTEEDGVGFRIDRLGLALSMWARQARNLHVRLGVVVQNGPTYVLSYEDGGEHADGSTIWIYNDNARSIIDIPTVENHYEGITGRSPDILGPDQTDQDVLTAAGQGDGRENDDWEGWQDDSTRFKINLDKVRRKSA